MGRIRRLELLGQTQLCQASVRNEVQILYYCCIHTNTPRGMVSRAYSIQQYLKNHLRDFLLELFSPEMRVFQLDLVDDVDAKFRCIDSSRRMY